VPSGGQLEVGVYASDDELAARDNPGPDRTGFLSSDPAERIRELLAGIGNCGQKNLYSLPKVDRPWPA
jgi:hypothetical protein